MNKMENDNHKSLNVPKIIPSKIFSDNRGWFYEAFNRNTTDLDVDFVQDNHSYSVKKGTLRGLHLQKPPFEQAKLIRILKGKIFDVVIDMRPYSKTYLQVSTFELDSIKKNSLFIPKGFAHGFVTLEDHTEVYYKVDEIYSSEHELTMNFSDPDIRIQWPKFDKLILSEKDSQGLTLAQVIKELGNNNK